MTTFTKSIFLLVRLVCLSFVGVWVWLLDSHKVANTSKVVLYFPSSGIYHGTQEIKERDIEGRNQSLQSVGIIEIYNYLLSFYLANSD
ncbi:hypothetical protein V6N13_113982 [Hibiscus sabdariffa]